MSRKTKGQRVVEIVNRSLKRNTHHRCWSRAVKSYFSSEERQDVRRLLRRFGVKYTKEMRRLRVAYKIPWGVPFDVRNPAACPQAGTWNGPLEMFCEVWKDSTQEERRDFVASAWPSPRPDPRRN